MKSLCALAILSFASAPAFAAGYYCIAKPTANNSVRIPALPGYGTAATKLEASEAAVASCRSRNAAFQYSCKVDSCFAN